jgi:hypothetical protein
MMTSPSATRPPEVNRHEIPALTAIVLALGALASPSAAFGVDSRDGYAHDRIWRSFR